MKRRRLILLALAATAACATPPADPAVALAPDLMMTLPSPATLGRDLSVVHMVTARYDGRLIGFEGHIEATNGRFRLAIIDALGRVALSVDWTGTVIRYQAAPWFPAGLRPENILADLVLIYWPPEVLKHALPPGAVFAAGPGWRTVSEGDRTVIRADFTGDAGVHYANRALGYTLDIRSMGVSP